MAGTRTPLLAFVLVVVLAGCSGAASSSAPASVAAPPTTAASAPASAAASAPASAAAASASASAAAAPSYPIGTMGDTLAKAKAAGVLKVGTSSGAPIGFIDANGTAMGVAPDICNEFAKREGIAKVDYTLFPFSSEIPGITSGRIDLGCDTFYVTDKRLAEVNFTDTLFYNVETMVTQKGNPMNIHTLDDLAGHTACTYEGTVWVDWLTELKAKGVNVTVQTYPSPTEQFAAISSGACDAGLIDAILPGYALQKNPSLNIAAVPEYKSADRASNAVSMPMRKDEGDVQVAFNKDLAAMKADGTLAKIFTKWGLTPPEYFINP